MITKKCTLSGKKFIITESDLDFYKKMEIISNEDYEKLKSREISDCVGLPNLCPMERQRRRLAFRNERNLYQRKCDGTGKKIISMYKPDSKHTIYENDYWWSDNWSALEFSRDFDFSRNFFNQFDELNKAVPKMARIQQGNVENSQYTNAASYNKNCYLIFSANGNEDSFYSTGIDKCKDCIDCYAVLNSELMYQCIESSNCYDCHFCQQIDFSQNLYHCHDCKHSNNLFACIGLRQKSYHVLNKPVTKEYFKKIMTSAAEQQKILKKLQNLYLDIPKKYADILKCQNCNGNQIFNCKNVESSWAVVDSEDCKYCDGLRKAKDCYDVSYYGCTGLNELCYESEAIGHGAFTIRFSKLIWGGSSDIDYSYECFKCKDCFGCSGLRGAQYCILNKQYSKEEYFKTREKTIKHMKKTGKWGEFFPIELSPFAYNETVAQEYFPLTKKETLDRNYKYHEEKQSFKYDGPKYEIPDSIEDINDEILAKILTCEETGKYYKIQKAELKFYRKMNLPVPRLCPDERHRNRMALRNPRTLFERSCDKCSKKIQTVFAKNRPETVYCEKCYLNEVN